MYSMKIQTILKGFLDKYLEKDLRKLTKEILQEDYDGLVPVDMAALERLPGVGHKTASVVMSQAPRASGPQSAIMTTW